MQRPAIQYGGIVADQIDSESLDRAVQEAVDRGLKDWTEEARVESVAIEVGEEFAYLIQRRAQEMALIRERVAQVTEIHHQKKKRTAATLIVVCAALAVTLCVMVHFWLKRRRSGPYEFPETRWRKRLGGTWSGGSTVAASLPSSHSS